MGHRQAATIQAKFGCASPEPEVGNEVLWTFLNFTEIGTVAYRLILPEGSNIHPVFHVSLLKQYIGDPSLTTFLLPLMSSSQGLLIFPDTMLQYRDILHNCQRVKRVLIQWHGLSPANTSSEDVKHLMLQYPDLDLEDKVVAYERGIVKLPVNLVNKGLINLGTCGEHESESEEGMGVQHVGTILRKSKKGKRVEERRKRRGHVSKKQKGKVV